jgi:cytochrome oxidase Cu insertion factor (SCO1/SenC/PrrC family)
LLSEVDSDASFEEVIAYVDHLRAKGAGESLLSLLAEQSPIYAGRDTNDAERLRGYILASFEATGVPAPAMAFIIEDLETALNPYTVAAAAKAMRGARELPEGLVALLLDAIERIRLSDDFVCFDSGLLRAERASTVTALMELFETLEWLAGRAAEALPALQAMLEQKPPAFSPAVLAQITRAVAALSKAQPAARHCCCASKHGSQFPAIAHEQIEGVELQDQYGNIFSFGHFFRGRPSVLTFFYTQCMNPNKCSLTIAKLARLQRQIRDESYDGRFNIAALSYDPSFDLPRRLMTYGLDRGISFDERVRLLRTVGPFDPIQRHFDLGVGYGSSTVNQHRIDLVVLDRLAQPVTRFVRMQWQENDIFSALKSLL